MLECSVKTAASETPYHVASRFDDISRLSQNEGCHEAMSTASTADLQLLFCKAALSSLVF